VSAVFPGKSFESKRMLVLVAAVYLVINLIGLTRSPLLWVDEATLNDAAREFVATGHVRSSVFADVPAFANGFYWQPPLQTIVSSAVYRFFGFGIWQTRMPPLLFATASVFLLGVIVRRFTNSRPVVVLSALLFGFDPMFSFLARSGRMDSMCIFFLLMSMWFALRALESCDAKWSAASGLFLSAAGISHPIAAGLGVGVVLASLLFSRPRMKHTLVLVMCASVLPLIWFAYAWFSGEWSNFRDQFLQHGSDHLASTTLWQRCVDEGARYIRDYARAPVVLPLYIASIAVTAYQAIRTRRSDVRVVIVWFVAAVIFNVVFMTKEVGFYGMYPIFVSVIMLAIGADYLVRNSVPMKAISVTIGVFVVMVFVLGTGGRLVKSLVQWTERNPENLRQLLEARVPRGSRVYGDGSIWYAAQQLGYKLTVDDYFLGKAYPQRRSDQFLTAGFVVLEKKQYITTDLSALSLVDSIVVTAPSFGQSVDTLYALYILQHPNLTNDGPVYQGQH
jgi:4-amino-4-deoxy-L-arabinose transferase-like glycosyltransferase